MEAGCASQSGIEHPHILDAIAHGPGADETILIMWERRPWNGSDQQLFQLQEKLNAYLSFALDGEMLESYPEFSQKKLTLQLYCVAMPDERTVQFLSYVRDQIALQNIRFEVRVVEPAQSCDCACTQLEATHDAQPDPERRT
jgi:hypothetical protein